VNQQPNLKTTAAAPRVIPHRAGAIRAHTSIRLARLNRVVELHVTATITEK